MVFSPLTLFTNLRIVYVKLCHLSAQALARQGFSDRTSVRLVDYVGFKDLVCIPLFVAIVNTESLLNLNAETF